jgi:hypothetical protein
LPIHVGAVLSDELLQRAREAAKTVDGRLEIRVGRTPPPLSREAFLTIPERLRNKITPPACADAVNVTIYDPTALPQRIRVESSVQDMLVEKVMPVYSRQDEGDAHATGVVHLAIVVGKDGAVIDVKPMAGPEPLMDCAMDAVRRWRYRPMLLNGFPVEVQTSVEVSLTLNGTE